MKKLNSRYFVAKLVLALCAMSAVAGFAAQSETVTRALGVARPAIKVQISGNVQRNNQFLALENVEAVSTGETLDWKISSLNEGDAAAQNYRVVGQIPKGTLYVADSAKGENAPLVTFSIDGGKTFSAQPTVEQKQPDGSVKTVPAPISTYTQVRYEWKNSFAAKSQLNAFYRVRVK